MVDLFSYAETKDETPEAKVKDNVLSVTQLSNQLRLLIEGKFSGIAVEGEISGFKKAASGHIYLDLKDDDNVVKAIIWRSTAERIKCKLEDGLQVVVRGKLTTYGARSNYQLIVSSIEPAGVGALMQKFEETRARLEAEGLFDASRKIELPYIPNKIGIVTSPTGAVIDDMLHRIRDRFPSHVALYPVLVQGVGAKEQVAEAVEYFNRQMGEDRPDVIIVARGGGSLEDLWAFNEEIVVRAIANSTIPVISAIGHEPDVTLCDYVADVRAPTPTAAAEMVVPVRADLVYTISLLNGKLEQSMLQRMTFLRKHITLMAQTLGDPISRLNQAKLRLDERHERFVQAFSGFTKLKREKLEGVSKRLSMDTWQNLKRQQTNKLESLDTRLDVDLLRRQLNQLKDKLGEKNKLLESYSPRGPLQRGYVYLTDNSGDVVRTKDSVTNPDVTVHFADGEMKATLEDTPS